MIFEPIQTAIMSKRGFDNSVKKRKVNVDGSPSFVHPQGLEPWTP